MLLDNAKAKFFGFFAGRGEIHAGVVIFCRKDRFTCFNERRHFFSPAIDEIIFGDRKIEMVDQVSDLVSGILDPDCQSALMRFICQPQGVL